MGGVLGFLPTVFKQGFAVGVIRFAILNQNG
jgi:hypothetical protein